MRRTRRTKQGYGRVWDAYVRRIFPRLRAARPFSQQELLPWRVLNTVDDRYEWPGDEWGDAAATERMLAATLGAALESEPQYLCEIGAGAGRYTLPTLERYPAATILSFDVSVEFDKALRDRCSEFVAAGRLRPFLLDDDPSSLLKAIERAGLLGRIDALYSFDAMVHVDLHTLVVYWASATRALRPGGVLAMNVADACNENGFMKLLHDAPGAFRCMGSAGNHFMWLSREIVESVLDRLGYEVRFVQGNGRDRSFVATLVEPTRCDAWLGEAGATWL